MNVVRHLIVDLWIRLNVFHFSTALKALTIVGFNLYRYSDHFESTLDELSEWCRSGKLQAFEHDIEGFENMPKALIEQLQGKYQGKVIIRVWNCAFYVLCIPFLWFVIAQK